MQGDLLQNLFLNVTITWVFSVVLFFGISLAAFEKEESRKVLSVVDELAPTQVLSTLAVAQGYDAQDNAAVADLALLSVKQHLPNRNRHKTHNRKIVIKASLLGLGLFMVTLLLFVYGIYSGQTDIYTASIVVAASVGLLISEVAMYLVMVSRYDFGVRDHIYRALKQVIRSDCRDVASRRRAETS